MFSFSDPEHLKTSTLILHPDVYAKISEELFEAAAEKNITITTSE